MEPRWRCARVVGACTLVPFTVLLTTVQREEDTAAHHQPAAMSLSWAHELPSLAVATSPIGPPERQSPPPRK